ncbi:lipopolysaccharide assembly protein LapB [Gilvimarinus agarilyticus]|uniref:lipopolysaccharide assembly protein LapB n=1 Tax=unclassified Gilvimarinus TaxID=2642066 RepID=UPI001C096446|nr:MULTISPECIES: lipopolysaccharide assembly protein LapB [unclassified Gilvimarinus]MBU2887190.1 lipopolysaccharide assembly protein LapB [Gilvimarinus agarilyticus]MDO6571849.1 lipopolysaccharide assembly protein LapB [Gilvimarinus sp. 2_MG-2023]MDO6745918.1 lipopolysaccharide assembly protein LapB [Gilvimarinus sp. 1_MG-2023]
MGDIAIFLLLLAGVAIGFLAGRFSRTRSSKQTHPKDYALNYYKGLSYLFNEQPDGAIDAFIGALEVNSDTLETHLALGNMLRRRGEVTKAIKVHQNLLARPGLNVRQQHESQLELARDYVKSGLLDRAEALLLELVKLSPSYKQQALDHLVEIYQDENEWDKAIAAASTMDEKLFRPRSAATLAELKAHFACEQAEEDLILKSWGKARSHLQEALKFDRESARASLLFAQLELGQGRYREAQAHLHRVPQQDPDYILLGLDMLCECYDKLGDVRGLHKYLLVLLNQHPGNSLVLKVAERLRWTNDDYTAADFIAAHLKERPSIRTLNRLVELHLPYSEGRARENLQLLKQLVDRVVEEKPSFCCNKCGFTGNTMHWLCPGCKAWGTVKPIRGVAGE